MDEKDKEEPHFLAGEGEDNEDGDPDNEGGAFKITIWEAFELGVIIGICLMISLVMALEGLKI